MTFFFIIYYNDFIEIIKVIRVFMKSETSHYFVLYTSDKLSEVIMQIIEASTARN